MLFREEFLKKKILSPLLFFKYQLLRRIFRALLGRTAVLAALVTNFRRSFRRICVAFIWGVRDRFWLGAGRIWLLSVALRNLWKFRTVPVLRIVLRVRKLIYRPPVEASLNPLPSNFRSSFCVNSHQSAYITIKTLTLFEKKFDRVFQDTTCSEILWGEKPVMLSDKLSLTREIRWLFFCDANGSCSTLRYDVSPRISFCFPSAVFHIPIPLNFSSSNFFQHYFKIAR